MSRMLLAIAVGILAICAAVARAESEDVARWLKDLRLRRRVGPSAGDRPSGRTRPSHARSPWGDSAQLKDASAAVRAHAAHALGHLGPAARPVIAALAPLVVDSDARVRRTAVRTWARIHPDPEVSVPLLEKVLEDADPTVRAEALEILAETGKPAVPALVQGVRHEKTVYWACLVLGEIGPDAAEAAPALADVLASDAGPEVRREAALTLGSIGPEAAMATPASARPWATARCPLLPARPMRWGRSARRPSRPCRHWRSVPTIPIFC